MTAEAGWYADPADAAWVRWWDGAAWSSEAWPAEPTPAASVTAGQGPALATLGLLTRTSTTAATAVEPTPSPVPDPAPTAALPVEPAPARVVTPTPAPASTPVAPSGSPAPVASTPAPPVVVEPAPVVAVPVPVPVPVPAPEPVAVPSLAPAYEAAPTVSLANPVVTTTATASIPTLAPAPVEEHPSAPPTSVMAGIAPPSRPEPARALPTSYSPPPGSVTGSAPHPPGLSETSHDSIASPARASTAPASASYASPGWESGVAAVTRTSTVTAFGSGSSGSGVGVPVAIEAPRGPRIWLRVLVGVVVLALALGGVAAYAVPKITDKKAAETAALQPNVLLRTAPRTLAGQKVAAVPGLDPATFAQRITSDGAAWAWASGYGKPSDFSFYIASDVPPGGRAESMKAQTDPEAARLLLTNVSAGLVDGSAGKVAVGPATEYGTPVGGRAWCMPITVASNGGGYCLWTNGKEYLQVLNYPSVESLAAKHMLAALKQLAKAGPK